MNACTTCPGLALAGFGIKDGGGNPMRYSFHDFRRLFIAGAIMHGMPPHIAQLVAGHRDINTPMGCNFDCPLDAAKAAGIHRLQPSPPTGPGTPHRTDEEWTKFIDHFEHRKVAVGDCARRWHGSRKICPTAGSSKPSG